MRLTISCNGKILHTENIEKRRNPFIGGIDEMMQILLRTIEAMTPEEKADLRTHLDEKLRS